MRLVKSFSLAVSLWVAGSIRANKDASVSDEATRLLTEEERASVAEIATRKTENVKYRKQTTKSTLMRSHARTVFTAV